MAAAAIGATLHFISSAGDSHHPPAHLQAEDQSIGISYGDTAIHVRTKVGTPTRKQGPCWIYDATAHIVRGAYLGQFADAVRYCFGDGPAGGKAVTAIEVHLIPHTLLNGKWYAGGWNHAVVVVAAPPPS